MLGGWLISPFPQKEEGDEKKGVQKAGKLGGFA